jgi:quercetin dioxygenase-like cupin family protein
MERFEDERGTIEDLFGGESVHVTQVATNEGAIRGNHRHDHTEQWTLLLYGRLLVADEGGTFEAHPGTMVFNPAGEAHAWQALEDSECLVFTKGPRGEDYESDTHRLEVPLL